MVYCTSLLIYGNHFLGGASGTNWFHFFLSADMGTTACWHTRMFSILPSLADVAEWLWRGGVINVHLSSLLIQSHASLSIACNHWPSDIRL